VGDGHENVNDAGIMAAPCFLAKAFIHFKWTFSSKLLRRVKAKQAKIVCGGLSDVLLLGEFFHSGAINLVRTHDG